MYTCQHKHIHTFISTYYKYLQNRKKHYKYSQYICNIVKSITNTHNNFAMRFKYEINTIAKTDAKHNSSICDIFMKTSRVLHIMFS